MRHPRLMKERGKTTKRRERSKSVGDSKKRDVRWNGSVEGERPADIQNEDDPNGPLAPRSVS